MSGRLGGGYSRGWTGRNYHVTGGHEAEAKAAEQAKEPNRFGLWVLQKLGYKGPDPVPPHEAPPPRRPLPPEVTPLRVGLSGPGPIAAQTVAKAVGIVRYPLLHWGRLPGDALP
jgi:hypothetical protein